MIGTLPFLFMALLIIIPCSEDDTNTYKDGDTDSTGLKDCEGYFPYVLFNFYYYFSV